MSETESDAGDGPSRERFLDLFGGLVLLALLFLAAAPATLFGVAAGCLVFAFLFSLFENALHHYSGVRLTAEARRGGCEEAMRRALARRDDTFLASKLGRALFQVGGIATFTLALVEAAPREGVAAGVILLAALLFLLVNIAAPYLIGRRAGHTVLLRGLVAYDRFLTPFLPVVRLLHRVASRLLRLRPSEDRVAELTDEILSAIEEGAREGVFGELDRLMLEGVVHLRDVTAEQVMTPRTEMVSLPVTATVEEAIERASGRGLSRLPVYRRSPDDVVGILYMKDLLPYLASRETPPAIERILRPPFFVPESKNARELLHEMKARQVHLAVVLDEYGGTAGVVTIEDILEEIVGEIADEHEKAQDNGVVKINENVATVEGRTHIDELNQALGLEVPEEEDYETVGGLLFSRLGRVPASGEHLDLDRVRFTVLDADPRRIHRVKVTVHRE